MTYDSINQRIVQMAGSGGSYTNDVWWYNAGTDVWTQIEPNIEGVDFVPPCKRDEMAIEYEPVNRLYWMFGGSGFGCTGPDRTAGPGTTTTKLVDPTLTATTVNFYKDWTVQGVSLYNTFAYVSAYDPATKTLTLATPFGGLAPGTKYRLYTQRGGGGTWFYSPVTHTWGSLTGPHWGYVGQSPGSRLSPAMAYSSRDQAMVMFGGQGNNDTWAIDVPNKTWVQQLPGGSPGSPAPRAQITNSMVYDSVNDVFILFGGCLCTGNVGPSSSETWIYRLSTNSWTKMNPAVSPPARQGQNMVYDSTNKVVVLFGGYDQPNARFFNDLWVYSFTSNTWTQVFPSTSPSARALAGMAYDPVNQLTVLYGGGNSVTGAYDVWALRLQAPGSANPVPVITSLSPSTTAAGGPAFTLTVTGGNFVPTSVVRWNGVARPTTYVRNTQLQASISASDIASPGSRSVSVFTPAPGGGTSTSLTLAVTGPGPTITSVTPNQGVPGATVPVTIAGSGFVAGAAVTVSGTGIAVNNVTVAATQITATLSIASGATTGARTVTVTNPGGGTGTLPGGFTVGSAGAATLTLAYNGKLRDRVGQDNLALGADGALDGTLTATLSATGGRTITALRLDSNAPGVWDTTNGNGFWVLGVAPSLDGAFLNSPGTMAVNFPVANGGSFVLFASDSGGIEFLPGRTLTLTATFSDGSTASASTIVAASSVTLTSVTPNQGVPGATVSVTIAGSGFVAGAAVTLSGTGIAVNNVSVAATQITATFSIASGATAGARAVTVTNPGGAAGTLPGGFTVAGAGPAALTLAYNGKLRDRVGQDNLALGADGALDGTLTATLSASGGRTVTALRLDSSAPGVWDTTSASFSWVLAVAQSLDGALLNAPGTMAVNFPVAAGGSFVVFASDSGGIEFQSGRTLTLTATFSDGSTAIATTMVP